MTEQTKDDSFLLCASDLSHAAIFDSYTELRACVNAVVKRITGLSQQKSKVTDSDVIAAQPVQPKEPK